MFDHIIVAGMIATQAAADAGAVNGPTGVAYITYLWVFLLSLLGGVVSFLQKMKQGAARSFNLTEFIGELFTSAFAGVMTFYLCKWANTPEFLTAAFVGVAGHMGSRAIFKLERLLERWFDSRTPGGAPMAQNPPEQPK